MDKFRWAYIGSGNIAKSTARSITRSNHMISAVWSRNSEKGRAFAKKYGAVFYPDYDSLLQSGDFDAVYIATPHTSHKDYSLKAMEAKKPVLCEKPIGVTTDEVREMISSAKSNDVYFCEAMWTWFSDMAYGVKNWIDDKTVGDILDVHIDYSFPGLMMSKNSRVLTPETAGGALLDVGIYPITYCYRLFGYPESISCTGNIKNGIDVSETVVLGYKDFRCTLVMSLDKLKEGCSIKGTMGSIEIPFFHVARIATLKAGKKQRLKGKTDYLTEFDHVAEEIRSGKKESSFVPHKATEDCIRIMDECRKQMNLVYPFEEGYEGGKI